MTAGTDEHEGRFTARRGLLSRLIGISPLGDGVKLKDFEKRAVGGLPGVVGGRAGECALPGDSAFRRRGIARFP
jgi:hypothetical protein